MPPPESDPDAPETDATTVAATAAAATPPPEPTPTAGEVRACAAKGGKLEPVCMLGEITCVLRYRDGGKRCTDKSNCRGECLYEGPQPPPEHASGTCQRTSDPCGCKAPIVHGHVEAALCVD